MYTLTFLSAQQLVKDEEAICKMLESVPSVVYDILFKVAYRYNKIKLLSKLMMTWPYPQFKLQKLLQTCWCSSRKSSKKCQKCWEILIYDELRQKRINNIIFGVIKYVKKAMMDDSQQLPKRILQQVDMTGVVSRNILWNEKFLMLCIVLISHPQIYNSSQRQTDDPQSQRGDQRAEGSPVSTKEIHVDLLIDLQMPASFWEFLKKFLKKYTNGPLHLKCRNFYTSYTFLHYHVKCFAPLDTLAIRRMDLTYSKITLMELKRLMSQMTTLQSLQSLLLPSFSIDERLSAATARKTDIKILAAELGKFKHLREISIHCLHLSDLVEYLLRDLPYSLESLQLSYCSLTKKDLTYMAQSHHSTHLIKLDLSGNMLGKQLDSFLKLLKSASNSLKWLNVTNCELNDTDFYEISSYLYSCTYLSYLGLYNNPISERSLIAFLKPFPYKLPNMKIMSIPICADCFTKSIQHLTYLRTPKQNIESNTFFSTLNEIKSMQITKEELDIEFTNSSISIVSDYFDLQ
ncbi:leucine-rich repeat-containing protein 14-like [Sminthopsis crassicaudata]|uniref:leucine-rich repeat-containing protein 14-like n=1 Tax=Sminthopsis crassicaudata TaxID=9301 RepID=UPI003D68F13A